MIERFDIRQDDHGWTVLDTFTRRPLVIMDVPQVGLDIQHALDLVDVLDLPVMRERRTFQD